jgi:hypothetical protein
MGAELLHVDRQTDMMKVSVTFTILQMHLQISRIPRDQRWWSYNKWKIFWACNIHCCPNFLFLLPETVFLYCDICVCVCVCVCVCTCVCVYVYINISDCIETICELLLLPNNTASETFLHKLGGAKIWLDIYHWDTSLAVNGWILDIGQKVLWSSFQQEVVIPPFTSKFSSISHSWTKPLLEI